MRKLRALVVAVFATATVGVGALAAAPSASAMSNCTYYSDRSVAYYDTAKILWATGNYALANYYYGRSDAYEDSWMHCMGFR